MELPDDPDIPTFLLSDGTLSNRPEPVSVLTIGDLFNKYQAPIPVDSSQETCTTVGDAFVLWDESMPDHHLAHVQLGQKA